MTFTLRPAAGGHKGVCRPPPGSTRPGQPAHVGLAGVSSQGVSDRAGTSIDITQFLKPFGRT